MIRLRYKLVCAAVAVAFAISVPTSAAAETPGGGFRTFRTPRAAIKGFYAFHHWLTKNGRVRRIYAKQVKEHLQALSSGGKVSALIATLGTGTLMDAMRELITKPELTWVTGVKGGVGIAALLGAVLLYRKVHERADTVRLETLFQALTENEPIEPGAYLSLKIESRHQLVERALDKDVTIPTAALQGVSIPALSPEHRDKLSKQSAK